MNGVAIAMAIHVLAIVWWIGGVAMVTTVLLPKAREFADPKEGLAIFQKIEGGFARQARAATLLAAFSGFYMVDHLALWPYFLAPAYWWLDAMVFVWALFTLVLFVAEPLFLHRWLALQASRSPGRTLALLHRLHWIVLLLSLITVFGAAAGSHGLSM